MIKLGPNSVETSFFFVTRSNSHSHYTHTRFDLLTCNITTSNKICFNFFDCVEHVLQYPKKTKWWKHRKPSDYHKGRGGDVREEVDRDSSADEYSRSQAGEMLAAAPAGRVGASVVPNHHPSLFEVPNTLLQVATETLSGRKRLEDTRESSWEWLIITLNKYIYTAPQRLMGFNPDYNNFSHAMNQIKITK